MASNGEVAISMAKNEKSGFVVLNLLLLEKDGWSILKEIREDKEFKDLSVLVLTAYDDGSSISKCVELNIAGYFVKSDHSLEEITKRIRENLK